MTDKKQELTVSMSVHLCGYIKVNVDQQLYRGEQAVGSFNVRLQPNMGRLLTILNPD